MPPFLGSLWREQRVHVAHQAHAFQFGQADHAWQLAFGQQRRGDTEIRAYTLERAWRKRAVHQRKVTALIREVAVRVVRTDQHQPLDIMNGS